ncbi:MAG: hypothetical protein JSU72_12340 [Deltaproteobacteria bacterium]|nr:MAG: hypothetical protein JSU72_12340 [Deltaproteobacteria bacterium]
MKNLADSFLSHLRQSELKLAKAILRWKAQKEGQPLPEAEELDAAASRILDQAREIARKRGKNLYEILKEEAQELFNSRSS